MITLDKGYEPKKYEDKIYLAWEKSGLFNPDVAIEKGYCSSRAPAFSMVLPPPNVTGVLHIGHATMLALQDLIVRFHRLLGQRTLWVPGTDHAAIATQNKVEKILREQGMKDPRAELGRKKFLQEVDKFARHSHDTIVRQTKKMGSSLDWSREAFTLDKERSQAVGEIFSRMYEDGLIYRGHRLVNWCPRCHSTLADDEVEYREEKGKLYWLKYGPFVLATSRPETKLGDTAVAVHPRDKRYKQMVGKNFQIPGVLGEFTVKVVADEAVDPEFGSGAIKVTPAHSFVDYQIAQRHHLPLKQIINEEGRMMANCGKYAGLTTFEAREEIVRDMEKMGFIDHIEENYNHNLACCYRCGSVIEPLPSEQWFIDVNKKFPFRPSIRQPLKGLRSGQSVSLKSLMQQVVRSGQIKIIPQRFEEVYFRWIDNLQDWCISRQIWYGHQVPVWYKPDKKTGQTQIFVGTKAPTGSDWKQDEDTLDTWFSSGLWTFSTLGWPKASKDLATYHPTSVMETGYDIIFFWVARMILMSTYALGEVPFSTVYLHGLVRDEQGKKMSKSLGNAIDPLDTIAAYGADATRLSLVIGNTPGNDLRLSTEKVAGFRNFTNKLWNIARFMLLNISQPKWEGKRPSPHTLADQWILQSLDEVIRSTGENIESFNFSRAGEDLREFTWGKLADWYLEIAKIEEGKGPILNYLLNKILVLWHPFMPFVTEAIYQEVYKKSYLLVASWPRVKTAESAVDKKIIKQFSGVQEVITAIRAMRADYKVDPVKRLSVVIKLERGVGAWLKENEGIIKGLARLDSLSFISSGQHPAGMCIITSVGEIYVDLSGVVDLKKEADRLQKELAQVDGYVKSQKKKLQNADFLAHAPAAVIEKEREKYQEAEERVIKLKKQLTGLK
ncbi:MAG TPA: valine--tRNA ligase [Patescibacteria group bacterium]|nr:valine--tRNA ligase [Patescibacteria group bacterium]